MFFHNIYILATGSHLEYCQTKTLTQGSVISLNLDLQTFTVSVLNIIFIAVPYSKKYILLSRLRDLFVNILADSNCRVFTADILENNHCLIKYLSYLTAQL